MAVPLWEEELGCEIEKQHRDAVEKAYGQEDWNIVPRIDLEMVKEGQVGMPNWELLSCSRPSKPKKRATDRAASADGARGFDYSFSPGGGRSPRTVRSRPGGWFGAHSILHRKSVLCAIYIWGGGAQGAFWVISGPRSRTMATLRTKALPRPCHGMFVPRMSNVQ